MQLFCDIAGGARGAARAAPTQAAPIIGRRAGEIGDLLLDVKPVEISGRDAGFKEYGRATRTFSSR